MPNATAVEHAGHPSDGSLSAESLQVSLTVADARVSAHWYRDALGFTIDREHEREGRLIAVSLSAAAIRILLAQDNGAKGSDRVKGEGFSIQLSTRDDIDALAARAKRAGSTLDTEPSDAFGARVFRLRDPDGFRLVLSSVREASVLAPATALATALATSFATAYTAAWCSQQASRVAAHFAPTGSLTINGGTPAVGRVAIEASAQSFMTAFPDMIVSMDALRIEGDQVTYHWTLTGTNTGPNGTGNSVRISGSEQWTFTPDGLIARSLGQYEQAEYDRQLTFGPSPSPRG